jgi:hypothetical protein
MKRIFFTALMVVCSFSWADWEYTDETERRIEYHDKSTIRRSGSLVKMWSLSDNYEIQTVKGLSFKSTKQLYSYNCDSEMMALVSMALFSGSMGAGTSVHYFTNKESELKWVAIIPESVGEISWKIACARR